MIEQAVVPKSIPNILVVDDTPANLQVLSEILKKRGYKVRPVPNGKLALQAAKSDPPDLILLDINMPEMNGYEVCEHLKADDRLKEIPVIFVSAMNETMDKVKAFSLGGVDYITKPFQFEEVTARVTAHLELRQQKRSLEESCNKLKELESLKDSLFHMIVHDMRMPLTVIIGFLKLADMSEEVSEEEAKSYIHQATVAADTLLNMVNSLLDVNKMEAGVIELNLSGCELIGTVKEVLANMEPLRENRSVILDFPDEPTTLVCDQDLISRVIQNLLSNAFKFTPADGGEIRIGIEVHCESTRLYVRDNGPGIPLEYHDKLFKKFGQLETRTKGRMYSTGLGLAFCKLAVEAHGGRIGVDSAVGMGSTFWFELPTVPNNNITGRC